jgi:hypothetical protein
VLGLVVVLRNNISWKEISGAIVLSILIGVVYGQSVVQLLANMRLQNKTAEVSSVALFLVIQKGDTERDFAVDGTYALLNRNVLSSASVVDMGAVFTDKKKLEQRVLPPTVFFAAEVGEDNFQSGQCEEFSVDKPSRTAMDELVHIATFNQQQSEILVLTGRFYSDFPIGYCRQ